MSAINPNCDGSHCHMYSLREVRRYPLHSDGAYGGALYLCRTCFAYENAFNYRRGFETGNRKDWVQHNWHTARVMFNDNGDRVES
jgi:hypothetical protein